MIRSKGIRFGFFLLVLSLLLYSLIHQEKRVLIIGATEYEETVAKQFPYTCYFYPLPDFTSRHYDLADTIDQICMHAKKHRVDGLLSKEDFAGTALVSICAQKLGLTAPSPLSVLTCQHKYHSRIAQKHSVPEATPSFSLGVDLPLPCFVKPIKSSFSRYAQAVSSAETEIQMPDASFFDFFDQLIAYATPFAASQERALAEELLEGMQVTWEGFVHNGKVSTIGIVDSHFFPGTISFQRFQYPSALPQDIQRRIEEIATKFLTYVDLDNTLCNIELMYDPQKDRVCIIEVNPRMALQFCDLYEKVDGTSSYEIALALATGAEPKMTKNAGAFRVAASFVLRTFEDGIVTQVPTSEEIEHAKTRFPDAVIIVDYQEGQRLSDCLQDGTSYRYGLIHLGGKDEADLFTRYEECKNLLPFILASS